MNCILTTHVTYRGKVVPVSQLKPKSQIKIAVECKHGKRQVRWSRVNQLCRKCTAERGLYNTSKKGRRITWGDKISKAKRGIIVSQHKKPLYSKCCSCDQEFLSVPNKKFCSPECCLATWKTNNPKWNENYYKNNKKAINSQNNQWRHDNKGKVNALGAKYRAAKLQATPLWLTDDHLKQIEEFYIEARRLTQTTNIKHHVDHIIPLQGNGVSGLHVPWNLQILTKTDNLRKSNKY